MTHMLTSDRVLRQALDNIANLTQIIRQEIVQ